MFFDLIELLEGHGSPFNLVAGVLANLVIVFFVLPFHEMAHAWAAFKLGDNTAKRQGRLTFNPLAHVDTIGSLLIIFFNFGWAKPVPVNPYNFKNYKRDMALTALAGPCANLIAALVGGIIANAIAAFIPFTEQSFVYYVLVFVYQYVYVNITLAVFNFIPFPPLDGSRIFSALLPDRAYDFLQRNERYFFLALLLIMISGAFNYVISAPIDILLDLVIRITRIPFIWAY